MRAACQQWDLLLLFRRVGTIIIKWGPRLGCGDVENRSPHCDSFERVFSPCTHWNWTGRYRILGRRLYICRVRRRVVDFIEYLNFRGFTAEPGARLCVGEAVAKPQATVSLLHLRTKLKKGSRCRPRLCPCHDLRKVEERCAIHNANVTVALLFQTPGASPSANPSTAI